ncbi:DUF4179 domain-containing protein [Mesobacillus subterraneus]|uniref:DUF4179 domain-containing protein n=1 Tax=Mesobacillus subterraneus TaxID=285983 RepID=UPI001CFDA9E3|nr:DUF4179 domain-containing protein [Mesobacillus subterraneus]WLR55864.1 DUF4179 domain-containing protein [Mesobacillus subterraneus]
MDKEKMLKHLDQAIEKQVPDVWDELNNKLHNKESQNVIVMPVSKTTPKKGVAFRRLAVVAAVCIVAASALTFTPALAAIQEIYDQLFSSEHIDDKGVRMAVNSGLGQVLDQTFYDEKNDITVHFQSLMTDDKETKLLFTFQSEKTDLENYYVDIFEGKSSIYLVANGQKVKLDNVGWGSRYYDQKENKVAEALSFESVKNFKGQDIRLEIENLTIYTETKTDSIATIWPLEFKLDQSAVSNREIVVLNKEFTFNNEAYVIKQIEFSETETRVVVTGSDTKLITENGMTYRVMSQLEHQYLNARKIDKERGYYVDYTKPGVFLTSAGKKADPIFSKGEVESGKDEYIMSFAPVKDRDNCVLEVGKDLTITLK